MARCRHPQAAQLIRGAVFEQNMPWFHETVRPGAPADHIVARGFKTRGKGVADATRAGQVGTAMIDIDTVGEY